MTKSAPISALACYAFDTLVAEFEKRPVHSLASFQKVLGEPKANPGEHPLFVTWNTFQSHSRLHRHHHSEPELRGCIGTFSPLDLLDGVKQYSLVAAMEDYRFEPIKKSEISHLQCAVTVLRDFEVVRDAYDWQIGTHGVKAVFEDRSSATFLPDVAVEQGWNKDDTLIHLARKAGYKAHSVNDIKRSMELTRYKGEKSSVTYKEYLEVVALMA